MDIWAIAAIRAIGYNGYLPVEDVLRHASRNRLAGLQRNGLVERHPEWTGCLQLTKAGYGALEAADADMYGQDYADEMD